MVSPSNDFVMLSIFISSSSSISGQWRSGRTERLKFHFLSCQISVIIPFFIQFSYFSLLVCSLFTSSFAFLNLSLIIFSSILFGSLCDGARISSWYSNSAMLLNRSCSMKFSNKEKSSSVSHGNQIIKFVLI
jgi:hypothetical protein